MLSLDSIRLFHYIAQEKSIIKGAELLNIPRSSAGKQIQALEQECGFTLFIRRKTGLELTQKGEELFRLASQNIHPLEENLWKFQKGREPERQILRIITTTGISHLLLINKIKEFRVFFPSLQIRIQTTNDNVDFLSSGFDIGILPKVADSQDVAQRKILQIPLRLYASPEYLEDYGTPHTFDDLVHHNLISFHTSREVHRGPIDWHVDLLGRGILSPSMSVNSAIGVLLSVRQGLGIGLLSVEMPFLKESGLIQLFDDTIGVDVSVYFVTKREERVSGDGPVATLLRLLDSSSVSTTN